MSELRETPETEIEVLESDEDLSPRAKPMFLDAPPAREQKPEDTSWGDWSIDPDPEKPLNPRQKEVARLLAAGKTQLEVAEIVGYTNAWVCRLASNSKVRAEIQRLQDAIFDRTVAERMKHLVGDSMNVIEEAVRSPTLKFRERVQVAQWVVEKVDGKAGQKVEVQNSSLEKFFEVISEMRSSGETIDVSPVPPGAPISPPAPESAAEPRATTAPPSLPRPPEPSPLSPPVGAPDWRGWLDANM